MSTETKNTAPLQQKVIENEPMPAPMVRAGTLRERLHPIAKKLCPSSDRVQDLLIAGMEQLLRHSLADGATDPALVKATLKKAITELQSRLSLQMDLILHHKQFQEMESNWRGLHFLVDRLNKTDPSAPVQIDVLCATKEELRKDLDPHQGNKFDTGLYHHLYRSGLGVLGADPYASVTALYKFTPSEPDVAMLTQASEVAQEVHAPFIGAADPAFFEIDSYAELQDKKPEILERLLGNKKGAFLKWNELRGKESSRYLGLVMPRFVLRNAWGPKNPCDQSFGFYEEDTSNDREHTLWGNGALAFANRMIDSFVRYDWYDNIVGVESGGQVADLPVPEFQVRGETRRLATETLIDNTLEYKLQTLGFIPLIMEVKSSSAYLIQAPSVQRPKEFLDNPEGHRAQDNYFLTTQLPYMLIVSRVAHYLKIMQYRRLSSLSSTSQIEAEIIEWLNTYTTKNDTADEETKKKRPLRDFRVSVQKIPGQIGIYKIDVSLVPHTRYRGADVTISLEGELQPPK